MNKRPSSNFLYINTLIFIHLIILFATYRSCLEADKKNKWGNSEKIKTISKNLSTHELSTAAFINAISLRVSDELPLKPRALGHMRAF